MLLSAFGVLAGGLLVNRLSNHSLFSALGLCVSCLAVLVVGIADFGTLALMLLMGLAGFANGVIMPSREHDRAGSDAARPIRHRVRLCHHRVQRRRRRVSAGVRRADGPRQPARGVLRRPPPAASSASSR